ncbi:fumarate/nitrate reduction transcriptional regulator Fnr [Salinicola sp. V024]|uniref:fumarate/nitrate reduction transcriptional regulator Fnr n=1 Tax=Salinicola sp. V024 TaxID=3459609 RepID=UPI004044D974
MSRTFDMPAHECQYHLNCHSCRLKALCLPLALEMGAMDQFDAIIKRRAPMVSGERLFSQGEPFCHVFAIRSGSLKLIILDQDGTEQIAQFYLPGELVGMDSINDNVYSGFAVALERTSVCEIPFHHLDALAERIPQLRNQLYRNMSKELMDNRRLIRLLTCKSAEERLASFFIDLALRFERGGYSQHSYRLPMSRTDIAHHLGLALETVSRLLKRFQQQKLMTIHGRQVEIANIDELGMLAEKPICPELSREIHA